MSFIDSIQEAEVTNYIPLSTGMGKKAHYSIDSCYQMLDKISKSGFGPNDTSTAHEVIDTLCSQLKMISESMADVDNMIDTMVDMIDKDIIKKENQLADSF